MFSRNILRNATVARSLTGSHARFSTHPSIAQSLRASASGSISSTRAPITSGHRAFSTSSVRRETAHPDDPENVIDPESITPMHMHPPPAPGEDFNIVMVGAGNIMFGSDEGPWNHSFRLEHKLGPRLKVVALIDPSAARANDALQKKRDSFVKSAYEGTLVYSDVAAYSRAVQGGNVKKPHAVVIGSPPLYRGGPKPPQDLELQLLKNFPDVAMFVEKPVATGEPWEKSISGAKFIADTLVKRGNIVSVGYMLRYLRVVQEMKKILQDNNLTVMATIARYACAYEAIEKSDWWTKSISMGPVIEQGTHFCDLSRYFGGDVDISTVFAHSVEHNEAPGVLSKIKIDESKIPPHDRIPRVTTAAWKYESGAVGQFIHAVALQGQVYSCELEVFADGFQLRLVDPYNNPTLYVRRPGDDHEEVHRFTDDDPFFSEVSNFIDAIEGGPEPSILSSYMDAAKTYELTWAIRNASERSPASIKIANQAKIADAPDAV
ncbi:nad binding dehydrogenase [Phaffia rhodozyma]|uniref:Nad binding dehydrogenase n=1 Tax=Phaffia rhodozyma TaxID=264483 RepID=A0A0F7SR85_PHARH|nr:nad binding dehydrogenase [Phaffia rhodozyma]